MTYKAKSLIFFSCFVISSLVYYHMEQQDEFQKQIGSETFVETQFHDVDELEKSKTDLEEEQK